MSLLVRKVTNPFCQLGRMSLSLLREDAFIGGQWSKCGGEKFDVLNPMDDKVIARVTNCTIEDIDKAITAASDAFSKWSLTSGKERATILRQWYNEATAKASDIAEIITAEAGKPLDESKAEVNYGNSFIEWFAEEARRNYGEVVPSPTSSKAILHVREPLGVAAVITPWNFPLAMITRKVGAALAAGCTVVVKPAEDTPLTALALAELAEKAGVPAGVINVVPCDRSRAADAGKTFCQHPLVSAVTFTGSTGVGKILYSHCAAGIKRVALELGGNAPFIVFPTADLDAAIAGLMASKFRNSGQTCVSANRILVHRDVMDAFTEKLMKTVKEKYYDGDKMTQKHVLSPMINAAQLSKVTSIVDDAVKKGAKANLGGKQALYVGPLHFEPTVLSDVREGMRCYHEEVFGPVASLIPFSSEEEAIKISNSTDSGLAGYFYTGDLAQAWRVSHKLQVGMVGVNEGIISTAEAAFGGVKQSGIGREGSSHGMDEFTNIKYICLGSLN